MTDPAKPSVQSAQRPVMTVPRFMRAKQRGEKLAVLTGYDHL